MGRAENCGVSAAAVVLGLVQILDKVVVPIDATTLGRAMLGSTVDTCSASSREAFGRIFTNFYKMGLTRLLSSVLVLRHIVDHGSGMFHAVFTGIDAPRAVFLRFPAVDASVAHELHLEICTIFSTSPLYFQHFPRSKFRASRFFGALEHSQV